MKLVQLVINNKRLENHKHPNVKKYLTSALVCVGSLAVHLHMAGEHLLQFTASLLPGGLVSFTPPAPHLLTYIKMSSSCTNMLTVMMQIGADLL